MTDRERWIATDDPAWMLHALGEEADERRLLIAMHAVQSYWDAKTSPHQWGLRGGIEAKNWLGIISIIDDKSVPAFACDAIRCLWPSPFIERERVECEMCSGGYVRDRYFSDDNRRDPKCKHCDGEGFVPCMLFPLINPRWRTPLVMNLARQVRGGDCACRGVRAETFDGRQFVCTRCNGKIKIEPNPEAIIPLNDALQDPPAYCDLPELIEHLRADCKHLAECWVIGGLLGTNGDG